MRKRKLEAEDAQVRRETGIYLEQVSKAKAHAAISARRATKKGKTGTADGNSKPREIRQRKPLIN